MAEVDTSEFMGMCHELANLAIAPFEKVMDYEVGKVLEKAVALTPAASISNIRGAYEGAEFSAQPAGMYTPQTSAGRLGRGAANLTKNGKVRYYLGNRYPDALWAALSAARKKSLRAKLRARGLAKRSFAKIARMLGLRINAPGYVEKAEAGDGKNHDSENLRVSRKRTAFSYGMAFENAQPTANIFRVGGQVALQKAINGRVKYFERNVSLKVFDSLKKIAKRYSGFTVK